MFIAWLTLKEPSLISQRGWGFALFGNSSQKHPDWFDQILPKCCVEPWWSRELTTTDKEIIHTQKHC